MSTGEKISPNLREKAVYDNAKENVLKGQCDKQKMKNLSCY